MDQHNNIKPEAGNAPATEEKEYICSKQCATCKCQTTNSFS